MILTDRRNEESCSCSDRSLWDVVGLMDFPGAPHSSAAHPATPTINRFDVLSLRSFGNFGDLLSACTWCWLLFSVEVPSEFYCLKCKLAALFNIALSGDGLLHHKRCCSLAIYCLLQITAPCLTNFRLVLHMDNDAICLVLQSKRSYEKAYKEKQRAEESFIRADENQELSRKAVEDVSNRGEFTKVNEAPCLVFSQWRFKVASIPQRRICVLVIFLPYLSSFFHSHRLFFKKVVPPFGLMGADVLDCMYSTPPHKLTFVSDFPGSYGRQTETRGVWRCKTRLCIQTTRNQPVPKKLLSKLDAKCPPAVSGAGSEKELSYTGLYQAIGGDWTKNPANHWQVPVRDG